MKENIFVRDNETLSFGELQTLVLKAEKDFKMLKIKTSSAWFMFGLLYAPHIKQHAKDFMLYNENQSECLQAMIYGMGMSEVYHMKAPNGETLSLTCLDSYELGYDWLQKKLIEMLEGIHYGNNYEFAWYIYGIKFQPHIADCWQRLLDSVDEKYKAYGAPLTEAMEIGNLLRNNYKM